MDSNNPQPDDNDVSADQQDGGPEPHTEDGSGDEANDAASSGTSDGNTGDGIEHDVHGDPDTLS